MVFPSLPDFFICICQVCLRKENRRMVIVILFNLPLFSLFLSRQDILPSEKEVGKKGESNRVMDEKIVFVLCLIWDFENDIDRVWLECHQLNECKE